MAAFRAWRCGNEIVHSLSQYRDATAPTSMSMHVYIISIYSVLYMERVANRPRAH